VEVQLIQWIKSCDKRIFEKKEIDGKYHELLGDPRRNLTIKKIKEMVEKFNLPALIIKTRNKEEYFLGADLNVSITTMPKVEENSFEHSLWLDDDHETVKNSVCPIPEEIKEEHDSCSEVSAELNRTQPKNELSRSKPRLLEEESCDSRWLA
jgi:hypothetical protein